MGEMIGVGLYQFCWTGGLWGVCLCLGLQWCVWCWGELVGGLVQGLIGWGSGISVCVVSLDFFCGDGRSRYLCIVLG